VNVVVDGVDVRQGSSAVRWIAYKLRRALHSVIHRAARIPRVLDSRVHLEDGTDRQDRGVRLHQEPHLRASRPGCDIERIARHVIGALSRWDD